MLRPRANIRNIPGKRWLNIALRTVHIIGLVLLGHALLSHDNPHDGALVVLFSGFGMFLLDTWTKPTRLLEISGFGVIVKLVLVATIAVHSEWAPSGFWLILILSTGLAHAPARIRHRRMF